MSYSSRFTGGIEIDPPLPWAVIMDSPFLYPPGATERAGWVAPRADVIFELHEDREVTPEGVLIRTTAVAICPRMEKAYNGYEVLSDLQTIADMAPGTMFTGRIDRLGVDGDQSRYKIVDGKAVEFTPEVIWPEGSE